MIGHVHACPECYEQPFCMEDCAVEPDLGTTSRGIPKGHHVVCTKCEAAKLAPSEVCLAKMLAAWEEWLAAPDDPTDALGVVVFAVGGALRLHGLVPEDTDGVADKGRALLDRARRAGVL